MGFYPASRDHEIQSVNINMSFILAYTYMNDDTVYTVFLRKVGIII